MELYGRAPDGSILGGESELQLADSSQQGDAGVSAQEATGSSKRRTLVFYLRGLQRQRGLE